MKKRLIALVLATCTVFSLLSVLGPVAGAALAPSTGADLALSHQYLPDVTQYNRYVSQMSSSLVKSSFTPENYMEALNFISEMEFQRHGEVSLEELEGIQYTYNTNFLSRLYRQADLNPQNGFFTTAVITEVPAEGILRLVDDETGEFIVDYKGQYPFVRVAGDVSVSNDTVFNNSNKWIRFNSMSDFKQVVVVSELELSRMVSDLNTYYKIDCSLYTSEGIEFILMGRNSAYANYAGKPYVALKENTATQIVRPPVTEDNILIQENNGLVIDQNNGTLNLIDDNGKTIGLNIENMELDLSSPHYTIDASQSYEEGDKTYFIHFKYEVTYNITNTYITYIGSNEPYAREEYELYYQLPDGRSSADLTAEEIAGMSFEFHDVVNYAKSATDISVRGLYHFDGNLDDSSYFTGQHDSAVWHDGASITYMESPSPFGGNLYLDNTAHSFSVFLPNNISSYDYTIQFRYYQASEYDTQSNIENSVSTDSSALFNDTIIRWDEGTIYDRNGVALAALPIGTWNEIALVRHLGQLFYFLNGHCIGNCTDHNLRLNNLTFTLGSTSRAYSMIDELRVLNFAITEGGVDYQPTNVPHDSNLVLVLPDSDCPTADEYFEAKSSYENLLGDTYNFLNGGNLEHFHPFTPNKSSPYDNAISEGFPEFTYRDWYAYSLEVQDMSVFLSRTGTDYAVSTLGYGDNATSYHWGFGIPLNPSSDTGIKAGTDYTFSVVREDGTVNSTTFNIASKYIDATSSKQDSWYVLHDASFDWGNISVISVRTGYGGYNNYYRTMLCIRPNLGSAIDVSYLELVEGSTTDIHLVKKTAVYKGTELEPNSAAIQTTIPINGYTVGGVRPSMPQRGDVWFPVSENRITSVQIYNGSMWIEVNARWWTGTRWIPIYAFDINTLEDLFDIADSDGVIVPLPDSNSFMRWWQLQWLDFRNWLEGALSNIGSGGGGTSLPDEEELPGEDAGEGDDHGWSFVDLIYQTKDGIWAVTKGIVQTAAGGITGLVLLIGDAGSFFEPFQSDHPEGIFGALNYGGDDIWD